MSSIDLRAIFPASLGLDIFKNGIDVSVYAFVLQKLVPLNMFFMTPTFWDRRMKVEQD